MHWNMEYLTFLLNACVDYVDRICFCVSSQLVIRMISLLTDVYCLDGLFSKICSSKTDFWRSITGLFLSSQWVVVFITHSFGRGAFFFDDFLIWLFGRSVWYFVFLCSYNFQQFLVWGVVGVTSEASDSHSGPTPDRRHCVVYFLVPQSSGVGIQTS